MSWRGDLLRILTLRCEEASALTSRELDEPLGLAERLAVQGHRLVCRSCRRFRRQLAFLRAAIRRPVPDDGPASGGALSPEARARIGRALVRAAGEDDEGSPDGLDQSDSPSR